MNECRFKDINIILNFLKAKYEKKVKDELWERYVANILYGIKQGLSHDKKLKSYDEILEMINPKKTYSDNRSAEQIYQDTMNLFKRE